MSCVLFFVNCDDKSIFRQSHVVDQYMDSVLIKNCLKTSFGFKKNQQW